MGINVALGVDDCLVALAVSYDSGVRIAVCCKWCSVRGREKGRVDRTAPCPGTSSFRRLTMMRRWLPQLVG